MAKSYDRDGLFGKFTEHYDDLGNKIGESRLVGSASEIRVEHYDKDGNKLGESSEIEGFFRVFSEIGKGIDSNLGVLSSANNGAPLFTQDPSITLSNHSEELPVDKGSESNLVTGALDNGKRLVSDVRTKIQTAHPHKLKALAVIGATLLVWALLEYVQAPNKPPSGWRYVAWSIYLLTLVPMSCGALMILISGSGTPDWFIKFSDWLDQRAAGSHAGKSWFNRFIARPALWSYEVLSEKAARVDDDMFRNGAKASAYAFTVILFSMLLFWIAAFAIAVVLLGIGLAITLFIVNAFEGNNSNSSRILGAMKGVSQGSESTVYSGTNVFNEQVSGRVDVDGTVYQGSSFFNEQQVGRVDEDGNIYEGTNFFNEKMTGRVDEDGNVYEGTNFFNERKVGRIEKN